MEKIEKIYKELMDCCYRVHTSMGPGLLERTYEMCLIQELEKYGLQVEHQKPMPLVYENVKLETAYRVDLLLENQIIVEVKSVNSLTNIHLAQILTYLKLSNCKLGMLVNFNNSSLKMGMKRVIHEKR